MNHTLDADGNLVSINDIPLTPRSVPLMSQARWGTEPLSIPMGYASQDPQPMSSNDREILQDEELGYSSENEEDEEGAGSFRTASSGSPSKDESTFSHHVEGSSSSDTSAHVESPSSAMSDPEFSGGDTELEDDVVSPLPSSHVVRKVGKAVYDRSPRTYEYARSYRPSASSKHVSCMQVDVEPDRDGYIHFSECSTAFNQLTINI
ncbi:hypothetical protein FRC02_011318 [Tulasnella sp. 418]|nr:hypothetical protein FRC02_011318 [Tulasnella sp. 418]